MSVGRVSADTLTDTSTEMDHSTHDAAVYTPWPGALINYNSKITLVTIENGAC